MFSLIQNCKFIIRDLIYPGLDLHTRNRASLQRLWKVGPRDVLDAGSGNGYFSWLAYQSGARVVAMNIDASQVTKAKQFLIDYRKADPTRLSFEQFNLYNLPKETRTFDEIICYEALEHILNDEIIIKEFYRILRPGGTLHLCCPYRLHPRHQAEVLDLEETGGHVRPGYTEEDYYRLLSPIGFEIDRVIGLGTKAVYLADEILRTLRNYTNDFVAFPLLPILLPIVWLAPLNPKMPFSLYVRAVKKES